LHESVCTPDKEDQAGNDFEGIAKHIELMKRLDA